jgi:hypothetical protein
MKHNDNTQHNYNLHNENQHKDTEPNDAKLKTYRTMTLSITIVKCQFSMTVKLVRLNVRMQTTIQFAECH